MRYLKFIGYILMTLSFVFIGRTIYSFNIDWRIVFANSHYYILLSIVYSLIFLLLVCAYKILLNITAHKTIPFGTVYSSYAKSNLFKYLPGNIFHYVARNQLAINENISHKSVALASLLELVCVSVASIVLVLLLSYAEAAEWLMTNFKILPLAISLLICCKIFALLTILFRKQILQLLNKFTSYKLSRRNIIQIIAATSLYLCFHLVNALMYIFLLYILGQPLPFEQYPMFIGLFSLSWFLGFITIGAPGGIGVREAVLTYFFASFISLEASLLSAIIYRLVSILGEVFVLIFAYIYNFYKKDK